MIIGLTGGLAAGKNLVAAFLDEFGAEVIDADTIAREIVEPGREAYHAIVEAFGERVVGEGGAIDRAALGKIVFTDKASLEKLNAIMHPRIIGEEKKMAQTLLRERPGALIVINAPLLIESGNYKEVDKIVVVDIDEELQLVRAVAKGLTPEEARARMECQIKRADRLRFADFTIDNSHDRATTKEETKRLFNRLTGKGV